MKRLLFKLKMRLRNRTRFLPGVYLKGIENIRIGKNTKILRNCSIIASKGKVIIGDNVHLNPSVFINAEDCNAQVILEDGVEINHGSVFLARDKIHIKRNTIVGPGVKFISYQHCFDDPSIPIKDQACTSGSIVIDEGSWIGANAVIMANIKIGKGSVIGAGAIVNKDIPDHCVAVGCPAKVIKYINHSNEKTVRT
ncbi:acyltransferase [Crenobacter cavernae]|uniref:Acyltransferase n=1 Tax=Crenobacter cavernae TaxID=2290923 RepID=A0ABY0FCI3_9NEIS|nr:acyltransferase [Crenobacter cavernae]RXZ43826.1 hypothetical protein EBB06_08085 [Crenobacter cavernae]